MALTKDVISKLTFDEEVLDVIVSGHSAIDGLMSFSMKTPEEASQFLRCYGFELDNPIERAELFGHFQEAFSFIKNNFLHPANPEGLRLDIPRKLQELTDPAQLLLWASTQSSGQGSLGQWACAVLKVMHTISHIDRDIRSSHFADVQMQIMDGFYKHVHNEDGKLYLGKDRNDPEMVELVLFETKPKKSRESILLKLLHKPENVAEDIFDRVGIRFVTKTKLDSLRVIKYLKDRYIIMPANIKPSRSKNSLVNVKKFRDELDRVLKSPDMNWEKAVTALQKAVGDQEISENNDNPHTSKEYAAIQFTCRQLIKIKNHIYEDIKKLKSLENSPQSEDIRNTLSRIDLKNITREFRFFYPFEVQVSDEKSHLDNMKGQSAHSVYKKNQLMTAMKRVMRGMF